MMLEVGLTFTPLRFIVLSDSLSFMKYAEIRLFWGLLKKLMANDNDEQTCEGPSQPQLGL